MTTDAARHLGQALVAVAARQPDKDAVYWGETRISYGQILSRAKRAAHRLRTELGVGPGDRVAIWLSNRPEFIDLLFGIFLADAVAVPINNFLKADEVAFILANAGARVLVTEPALAGSLPQIVGQVPGLRTVRVEEFANGDEATPSSAPDPTRAGDDLAVIIYTSGTTGRPKGAMLSHANLLHNVASCRVVLETAALDSFVVLLPMFHSFMLCVGILLPLTTGCSIVLVRSLHPLKNVIEEIMKGRATILPGIPPFFRALAAGAVPPNLPLRLCISGAAPLPVETLRQFSQKFPIPLIEGYGLSEASPVVSLNPIHGPVKAGSIGVPIHEVELTIQDEAGRILADGQVGELCVRGGNVMLGYWGLAEESARALRGGWLLTGDIGYRDAEGYFFITDRKKDMLLVNGINVYPREIEEVIYQFPNVKEAAVVGVPDARKGEQPVAFVVAQDQADLDVAALSRFLKERLADYKVPKQIRLLEALPRNATGKVLKTELRTRAT